ncbi:MAG: hypothetical protein DI589_06640 [Shinella sp.]|nr:MAG: hypothetical protein DI589_06640 [Shinella sp.]
MWLIDLVVWPLNAILGLWTVIGGPAFALWALHALKDKGETEGHAKAAAVLALIVGTPAVLLVSYGVWYATGIPKLWYFIIRNFF